MERNVHQREVPRQDGVETRDYGCLCASLIFKGHGVVLPPEPAGAGRLYLIFKACPCGHREMCAHAAVSDNFVTVAVVW
jgi:hypothetical protein